MDILSPTFGTLALIHADEGAQVEEGEAVAEVEVMKIFIRIPAPQSGTLHWRLTLGEVVGEGDVIGEVT